VALLALCAARLLHAVERNSFTVDEPHYVGTALYLWDTGDYHYASSLRFHPPLAYHLAGLPLLALDTDHLERTPTLGGRLLRGPDPPPRLVRRLSRLPFVLLTCWGGFLAFAWAREVAGNTAALLALFFVSFSPPMLGYGGLAHSDIVVTVLYLQTLYTFWRWWRRTTPARFAVCGISLGLALLAKLSALLLLPTLAMLLLGMALGWPPPLAAPAVVAERPTDRRIAWSATRLAGLLAIALVVLWLGYGGSFASVEIERGPWAGLTAPGYLHALLFDFDANARTRPIYFFGEILTGGAPWYVLPVVFLLKTPLPVLALLVLAIGTRPSGSGSLGLFLGAPILVYALVACFVLQVPLGLRYVLPIYPLLHLFLATRLAPALLGWRLPAILAAGAWLAWSSLSIHPHYLAYFNELAGGPTRAHRYVVESNLDWGQDLGTLARYLQARGNPPVQLAYFGPERPESYGINATRLRGCEPVTGVVAVSATLLRGVYALNNPFRSAPAGCFDWLLEREPVAQPGFSILVYELPEAGARAGDAGLE